MLFPAISQLERQTQEFLASFNERGYACHHQIDEHGRIWRNLFTETDEILVALTTGLLIGVGDELIPLNPFEEYVISALKHYDIIGKCPGECQWIHAYEVAEVGIHSRLMRKSGVLSFEDYSFLTQE